MSGRRRMLALKRKLQAAESAQSAAESRAAAAEKAQKEAEARAAAAEKAQAEAEAAKAKPAPKKRAPSRTKKASRKD
ncbi:MAG: hypothetical protein GOVbin703_103 [Prokaryotic dsDNA virus sp.]|nr:MAG: hypothetical protein GOVbin703_103 [Prokaryotic dsDNA virus sp.]|tara:strand:- start:2602 stop:2832 length:231 start_codon:yes stop_codon:yes gene_type:complete